MANVLFLVKSTITDKSNEAAWNYWYNETHCRQILKSPGAIGARRFRVLMGEDQFQYITLYEFENESSFRGIWESDLRKAARSDYELTYGSI